MRIGIYSIERDSTNVAPIQESLRLSGIDAVEVIDVLESGQPFESFDFIFCLSRALESLPQRFVYQIRFMQARKGLEVASCDSFFDSRKEAQATIPHPGCLTFTGAAFAKLNKREVANLDFDVISKSHAWLHWDMPLVVVRDREVLRLEYTSPACFLSVSRESGNTFLRKAKSVLRTIKYFRKVHWNRNIKKRFSTYAQEVYQRSVQKRVGGRAPMSEVRHLLFMPWPGNGGADFSNVSLFKEYGVNLNHALAIFTRENSELTDLQARDYEEQFGDHVYLSTKTLNYFEPWDQVLSLLSEGNIESIFVYANDFGARVCQYVKQHRLPIKTNVILHNRLIGGWLGHAISYKTSWDLVIAISEQIAWHLQTYGFDSSKIDVRYLDQIWIPNLTKPQILGRRRTQKECLEIGFIGRLGREKGIMRLLDLAEVCRDTGLHVRFRIIGSGEEAGAFLSEIGERQLSQFFYFCGYLRDPLPEYYALDGLVLVSDIEGISLVAMEAIHFAVPVFTTPAGEMADFKTLRKYSDREMMVVPGFSKDLLARNFSQWVRTLQTDTPVGREFENEN